jgi:DNA-binding NarL/FixJ family response regulator
MRRARVLLADDHTIVAQGLASLLKVLRLIAEGQRMKEIAATLLLSTRTVETHKYAMK